MKNTEKILSHLVCCQQQRVKTCLPTANNRPIPSPNIPREGRDKSMDQQISKLWVDTLVPPPYPANPDGAIKLMSVRSNNNRDNASESEDEGEEKLKE